MTRMSSNKHTEQNILKGCRQNLFLEILSPVLMADKERSDNCDQNQPANNGPQNVIIGAGMIYGESIILAYQWLALVEFIAVLAA